MVVIRHLIAIFVGSLFFALLFFVSCIQVKKVHTDLGRALTNLLLIHNRGRSTVFLPQIRRH